MDNLANSLVKPTCQNLISRNVSNNVYKIVDNLMDEAETISNVSIGSGIYPDGSLRLIECLEGYEEAEFNSGKSPQHLKCDRGRWVPINYSEPLLICEKPCLPYESVDLNLDPLSITVVKLGSDKHLAKRKLICNAGFESINVPEGIEELVCRNGVWDRRSIECIRKDSTSQIYLTAECGNNKLINILDNPETYNLKEVDTKTAFAYKDSNEVSEYKISAWNLKCTRGYISQLPNLLLICAAGNLFTTLKTPSDIEETTLQSDVVVEFLRKLSTSFTKMEPELDMRNQEYKDVKLLNPGETIKLLDCKPDIKEPPIISTSQPGLSNTAFYILVFAGSCGLLVLGMFALYLKKTRCFTKSFFTEKPHKDEQFDNDDESEPKETQSNPAKDEQSEIKSNTKTTPVIYKRLNDFKMSPKSTVLTPIGENITKTVYRDLNKLYSDTYFQKSPQPADVPYKNTHSFQNSDYRPTPNKVLLKMASKNRKSDLKSDVSQTSGKLAFTYERNNEFSGAESVNSAFYYSELDIDHEKLKRFWQYNPTSENNAVKKTKKPNSLSPFDSTTF